jgi:BON domain-containing protein
VAVPVPNHHLHCVGILASSWDRGGTLPCAQRTELVAYPALEKYALGVQKPIRIIVKNGHVTLEGVVDSDADKDMAGLRAKGVPGTFSVTNNLQVVSSNKISGRHWSEK